MSFPHSDFDITAGDGLELKARTYQVPEGTKVLAKILYVHGFSEYVDHYQHWFPRVAEAGYEVTFFDQRGFGRTAVDSSFFGVTSQDQVFDDLDTVIKTLYDDYTGPLVLWGHSMGGAITLNYMVMGTYKERFSGYIANSPCITMHPKSQDWKAFMVPFLNRFVPWFRAPVPLRPEFCTNDPERQASYPHDKLRHNIAGATLAHGMITRGQQLLDPEFTEQIVDRPLLLNHGTADYICDYESSEKFIEQVNLSDKTLRGYQDWPHELPHLKAEDSDSHLADVLGWLKEHQQQFTRSSKL